MATTFREDIVTGIMAVLNAYVAANPGRLARAYRMKPLNVVAGDLPAVYIEGRPESITHSEGVRTRTMSPSFVLVDRVADPGETTDRLDPLVDDLVDAFTAVPQLVTGTIWEDMTVTDIPVVIGEAELAGVRFVIGDVSISEGRD
jgi:hypothetical protein